MTNEPKYFRGTMTVYLGANARGMEISNMAAEKAKKHNMSLSEYVVYCILEQQKRETV